MELVDAATLGKVVGYLDRGLAYRLAGTYTGPHSRRKAG
jgi:hypothetical protein